MSVDDTKKVINNFRYGVLIKVDVPSNHIAGKEAIDKKMVNPYIRKVAEITAKIESEAFYDGYHLALAFSSGSCKGLFCPDIDCQALLPGKGCLHRLKARSSMEAVGIDVYKTVSRIGWDIYPIGDNTSPKDVPFGLRVGIVLID
jgi:predicted metal-binding protein